MTWLPVQGCRAFGCLGAWAELAHVCPLADTWAEQSVVGCSLVAAGLCAAPGAVRDEEG